MITAENLKNLPFEEKIKLLNESDKAFVQGYIEALTKIHCQSETKSEEPPPDVE